MLSGFILSTIGGTIQGTIEFESGPILSTIGGTIKFKFCLILSTIGSTIESY